MNEEKTILDAQNFTRTVNRLSHEIVERNRGAASLGIVGIRTRGEYLARRIAAAVLEMEKVAPPIGTLDITLYRDDLRGRLSQPRLNTTDILYDITGKDIVLVDDVLFTGRTVRAALNALMDIGRPASIQLAVLVDRGHRELPIKADFVGKNVPTSADEEIQVRMAEADGEDAVYLGPVKL
ncbi:MAG TPA: bifunctional pyr operon transcriptional regulator/uracil phosphoribosyltransferase PyrR [Bacteroidota bacterium]|nr:bifunctional pyr operon transcriptional regulator/uracil phosphoribosyltransferase PyrR [Bacteroidota bacterium]